LADFGQCLEQQISKELKQFHNVEELDDIRVIKDRQTSALCITLELKSILIWLCRDIPRIWVLKISNDREIKGFLGALLPSDSPIW
jgi:hypothetical protein